MIDKTKCFNCKNSSILYPQSICDRTKRVITNNGVLIDECKNFVPEDCKKVQK